MSEPARIELWKEGECRDMFRKWWRDLDNAPGNRAELRRAKDVTGVILCPAFHGLRNAYLRAGYGVPPGGGAERLAMAAGVAAHVREDDPRRSFAAQMASPSPGGSGARVSGLRFRRLLSRDRDEGLYRDLIRAVHLLDRVANLASLADSAYRFNDPVKRQWAFDYYSAAPSEQ